MALKQEKQKFGQRHLVAEFFGKFRKLFLPAFWAIAAMPLCAGSFALAATPMVAGGGDHTIVLRDDGTVWAWGKNNCGQLGDGTTTNRHTPVQVSGLTNVSAVACGYLHTIALRDDGTVWAWGMNGAGQIGDGTTLTDRHTPVQVPDLTNVSAIAGGNSHTIALRDDGTAWAWGWNAYGQLGDGTTTHRSAPVQVSGLTNVSAVAAGGSHTIALRNDGTVRTWGGNGVCQLGDGTQSERHTPVQVSGLTNVSAIAAGYDHTIAFRDDGAVWTWGGNYDGQLGDGTSLLFRYTLVQVSGLTNASAIAGGNSHTIALRDDGTVWAWGNNGSGQIGDGTTTERHTPVQSDLPIDSAIAEMQSPSPGSVLGSTVETFTWNNAGAEKYWLWVGTSAGGNDIFDDDMGTDTSAFVSGLPGNGEIVYARLWSKVDGEWLYAEDCAYTAFDSSSMIAEMQSPAAGTVFSSTTVTFTWNDTGADNYWLTIGSESGGNDLYNDARGTNTSAVVSGLPDGGETLYARIWSKVGGEWLDGAECVYTAFDSTGMIAEIQSPESGTVLASATATFTWNDTGAEKYWLLVGTSPGASDVYSDDLGTGISAVVSGLPNGGETVYVRLWSKVDGEWLYGTDCSYTAFDSGSMAAEIQSPTPGTRFSSTTETFTWNDTGAEKYWLWVGTSSGGSELHSKGYVATSAAVSGMPSAGEDIYVRIWSKVDGEWLYVGDCVYTAVGP